MPPQPARRKSSATSHPHALKPFQREDIETLGKYGFRALVANAPGTGKTIVCLSALSQNAALLTPTLVVAPSSTLTNWQREALKWVPGVRVHVVSDTCSPLSRTAHLTVISWSLLTVRYLELLSLKCKLIIADEAHAAKNEEALRTQALHIVARRTPHILLLTGTPLINRPGEMDSLRALLGIAEDQPIPMVRRLLEDVAPEIPPKTRSTLPITLRPKDRYEYDSAESDFASWLEAELQRRMSLGEALVTAQRALAAEALTKAGYLRRLLGHAKVHAASDWIARATRLGEPVVVFAEHKEVISLLQGLLRRQRIGFVTLDGSATRVDRQVSIDLFQQGRVPVFIGSKAASTGITLIRARHLLFVERYYTSSEEEQAEDRIRRIGQEHPTTIWFLHATGTIDDRIARIIERKREMIRKAIGAADIVEREEDVAVELIASWGTNATSDYAGKETDLGLGKSLPPIPAPHEVCALVFKPPRWTSNSAMSWALMHGFRVDVPKGASLRITTNSPAAFLPGKFYSLPISSDIHAILGIRRPQGARKKAPAPVRKKRR
jgi:SWI/SNF-related matrix-associated actin-dependent regulator of chromatin subfamily A-like protein 1